MGKKETLGNASEAADELLQGHALILNQMFAYADSLALRCAVELRIADIINSYGKSMSLSQIASKIESRSPDVSCLVRVMHILVRRNIFTVQYAPSPNNSADKEALYGLTSASKWLIRDKELSVAPMLLTFTDPSIISPWYKISQSIKEGGTPFEKAYGQSFWDKASTDQEFNNLFNTGMASATKPMLDAIISGYKEGFTKLNGTLVDVGGGIGRVVSKIVEAYPHIKGINFDMSHVIATAPQYTGVTHVAGDMFKEIPTADAVFIKSVLLDWNDEDCIKILKNCQKAVSEKKGKVIIVDTIVYPDGNGLYDDAKIAIDLLMMAVCVNGKGRTEDEWKNLLNQAGFTSYNFLSIPTVTSIIEAFP